MPRNRSQAEILLDLDNLTTAAQANEGILPSATPHRIALEEEVATTRAIKHLQSARTAIKQRSTQDFDEHFRRAQELAKRLRGSIMADLGPRNELLVNFGIAPQRNRTRRPTLPPTEPTRPPSTEATAPPAETQPDTKPTA